MNENLIHGCLGNEGRIRHTISCSLPRIEKGKFVFIMKYGKQSKIMYDKENCVLTL